MTLKYGRLESQLSISTNKNILENQKRTSEDHPKQVSATELTFTVEEVSVFIK